MSAKKQQIEQTMADMAMNKLSDTTPVLQEYLVGFELITVNEDGTRAAGILGFEIGGRLFYIPVLYLNGRIKGMDIIYDKDRDTFTSLSRPVAEFLISQAIGVMGESGTIPQNAGTASPASLRIFSQPPQSQMKSASDMEDAVVEWFGVKKATEKGMDVPSFLRKAGPSFTRHFIKQAVESPELFEYFSTFYNPEELKKIAAEDAAVSAIGNTEKSEDPKRDVSTAGSLADKDSATSKVTAVYSKGFGLDPVGEDGLAHCAMDSKEKEKLVRKGYVIVDRRKDEEKVAALRMDLPSQFSSVSQNGRYEMINKDGVLVKACIIPSPILLRQNGSAKSALVLDESTGDYVRRLPENIFVRDCIDDVAENTAWKKAISMSQLKPGKHYILLNEKMDTVSIPLQVSSVVKGPDLLSVKARNSSWGDRMYDSDHIAKTNSSEDSDSFTLREIDQEGGGISRISGTVYVPKNYKFLEVVDGSDSGGGTDSQRLIPGNHGMLSSLLHSKGVEELTVSKSASDYVISLGYGKKIASNSEFMKRAEAEISLVLNFGLSVPDAELMMKKADENGSDKVRLVQKVADIYDGMPFPEVDTEAGATKMGVPEQGPGEMIQQIPMNNPQNPDPFDGNLANWDKISPQEMATLERASKSESQQVFDPAMIAILTKTNRSMSLVKDMLPEIERGLDRLCRLLLLFYWHNSEFGENYGKDDMAEFEQTLLDSIKRNGTVVLFLKQNAEGSDGSNIDALSE